MPELSEGRAGIITRDENYYCVGEYLRDVMLARGFDAVRLAAEMAVPIGKVCELLYSHELRLDDFIDQIDQVFGEDAADRIWRIHERWFQDFESTLNALWFKKQLEGDGDPEFKPEWN